MNLEAYQQDLEYHFKLYCIESVPDADAQVHSKAWRFLERLASDYDIHNIYKACEDMEGLEASLGQLIYEDKIGRASCRERVERSAEAEPVGRRKGHSE